MPEKVNTLNMYIFVTFNKYICDDFYFKSEIFIYYNESYLAIKVTGIGVC